MGVVNATPDSFSGDGLAGDVAAAMALAERLVAEGADLIDVGGESTRPGSERVDAATELRRVLPVLEALADAGVPSFQPSIIHATVLRYGSCELRAEALAEAARCVHIESSVPIRQLVLSKETVYPSLAREVIECMPLRGDSSLSTPSTFS